MAAEPVQAGVAPQADLLFVEISAEAAPGPSALPAGLGDSVRLVEAVSFVFDTAAARPCAVNVSVGSNSGPHDGSSLVERMLDSMAAAGPNRSIVVAAGNAFSDGIHFAGHLAAGGVADLDWVPRRSAFRRRRTRNLVRRRRPLHRRHPLAQRQTGRLGSRRRLAQPCDCGQF